MHLLIEHLDGSRTEYFGVSDYDAELGDNDNQIHLWYHRDVSAGDKRDRTVQGTVKKAVDEMGYNEQGAYETIGDLTVTDGTKVVVQREEEVDDLEILD